MFEKLFEPIKIGRCMIKNRIVMAPMGTCLANESGAVTDRLIDYYVRRAEGGVGLIIVENASVSSLRNPCRLGIYNDHLITGLCELVEKVKEAAPDIRLFVQLNQKVESKDGVNDLNIINIQQIVENFVNGAKRAKASGFDGIELHGGHHYIINQFLSPFYNKRKDEYGGSIGKNLRFATDIIRQIKKEVGTEYPVIIRQNGCDYVPGGLSVDNGCEIAKNLGEVGANAVHVTAGGLPLSPEWSVQPMGFKPGCLVALAEKIKDSVQIPVIAVGKINDPVLAENIIRTGKADMVAIGRGLLADPEIPNKIRKGKMEEIRKCISCRYCIGERVHKAFRIRCKINPTAGREKEFAIRPAKEPQKIMVVGGGPAGLTFADVAKSRGHEVKIYEKEEILGGQLLIAMAPPHKAEIKDLIGFLQKKIERLKIPIIFNCNVTAEIIEKENPDAVVIATGGIPWTPLRKECGPRKTVTYKEILSGSLLTYGRQIIIFGGGEIGCECAEYIYERSPGSEIAIIKKSSEIAPEMEPLHRKLLIKRLNDKGVKVIINAHVTEINEQGIILEKEGEKEYLLADLIVWARGVCSNNELEKQLEGKNIFHLRIGDCNKVGNIEDAILSAWMAGLRI